MENCFGADNEKSGLSKDKKMGLAETDYDIVIVKIWIRFVPGSRQTMTTPKNFATSYYYRDWLTCGAPYTVCLLIWVAKLESLHVLQSNKNNNYRGLFLFQTSPPCSEQSLWPCPSPSRCPPASTRAADDRAIEFSKNQCHTFEPGSRSLRTSWRAECARGPPCARETLQSTCRWPTNSSLERKMKLTHTFAARETICAVRLSEIPANAASSLGELWRPPRTGTKTVKLI